MGRNGDNEDEVGLTTKSGHYHECWKCKNILVHFSEWICHWAPVVICDRCQPSGGLPKKRRGDIRKRLLEVREIVPVDTGLATEEEVKDE